MTPYPTICGHLVERASTARRRDGAIACAPCVRAEMTRPVLVVRDPYDRAARVVEQIGEQR